MQRFGGSLNLNIHFHVVVLDGVFVRDPATPKFLPSSAPARSELEAVVKRTHDRIAKKLAAPSPATTPANEEPNGLEGCAAAALQRGLFVELPQREEDPPDVHGPTRKVGSTVKPTVAQSTNTVAPNVQPRPIPPTPAGPKVGSVIVAPNVLSIPHWKRLGEGALLAKSPRIDWATLPRRTFEADVLECPNCEGRLKVRGVVMEPATIHSLLSRLEIDAAPTLSRARDPTSLLCGDAMNAP